MFLIFSECESLSSNRGTVAFRDCIRVVNKDSTLRIGVVKRMNDIPMKTESNFD